MAKNNTIFSDKKFTEMSAMLKEATTNEVLYSQIVNLPFKYKIDAVKLYLGIMVFLLVNKKNGTIDRVALSRTALARLTLQMSAKPFEEIKIPLGNKENVIAKAIRTGKPQSTTDWKYLFTPELTPEEARLNQASGAIGYSAIYPFTARDGGAIIFSYYQYPEEIGLEQKKFQKRYLALVNKTIREKTVFN